MGRWLEGRVCLLASLVVLGCSEDATDETAPPVSECPSPNRLIGDRCLEPGVQDDGCPAGTLGVEDGSCRPAGVPPELCAEGFVHDGDAACMPILPAGACPRGQLAVPGDESCRPVMACGAGRWGDIPVDGATIYVDASYTGSVRNGQRGSPWTTITEAIEAAAPGALIAIAAGTYVEEIVIDNRVRLWGSCPDHVEIVGSNTGFAAALQLVAGASGSEVHGISVTGNAYGIVSSGAQDVLIEAVWVHDTMERGLDLESTVGPTSCTLRDVLIEHCHNVGAFVLGAEITLERAVVRGTLPHVTSQGFGRGIQLQPDPTSQTPTSAIIEQSVIEDNRELGVNVMGSQATFHGVVVRRTTPQLNDQIGGYGVMVQGEIAGGAPGSALISSSLVEDNVELGVYVLGAEATLEGVVVRRTAPAADDQEAGRGVQAQPNMAGMPSSVLINSSLIEDNHEAGVIVSGSSATLEGVVVRRTQPRPVDRSRGDGVLLQWDIDTGASSTGLLKGSRIEDNHYIGVNVSGSTATLEGLLIRGTKPRPSDQTGGSGIVVQLDPDSLAPSSATIKSAIVEDNNEFGVIINGAQATLDADVVRRTLTRAADGSFGDGLAVASIVSPSSSIVSSVAVTHSHIGQSARAGFATFGANARVGTSTFSCNAFDLDGETVFGLSYTFENLGDNRCGCPEPTLACVARSSDLAPPEPVGD